MTTELAPLLDHARRLAAPAESDADLLARFAAGRDEAAFAALVGRHGPMVWRACRRVLRDPHAAEDAFQAAFLVLARRAGQVRRPEALAGWLYGVSLRVARKARPRGMVGAPPGREPAVSGGGPAAELTARELLAALDEEIERLPEAYRSPVVLCCLEGLSQDEAARRLGWSGGSVKGRLERGRARLRARLGERGLALAAALAAAEASAAAAGKAPAAPAIEAALAACSAGSHWKASAALLLLAGLVAAGAGVAGTGGTAGPAPPAPPRPALKRAAPLPHFRAPRQPLVKVQDYTDTVWSLSYSPDGRRLAGVGHDGAVCVWDAATGKRLHALQGHKGVGSAVAFHPNGDLLASAARGPFSVETQPEVRAIWGPGEVLLWSARSGELVRRFEGGVGGPAAFSPDGSLLAGRGSDGALTLWATRTGKVARAFPGFGAGNVAFSPDGSLLAASGSLSGAKGAGYARVWDAATGAPVRRIADRLVYSLTFSPDGKRLAGLTSESLKEGAVRVWDPATGEEVLAIKRPHEHGAVSIDYGPGGRYLVTTGNRRHRVGLFEPWAPASDGEVKVWDAATGKELLAFTTTVAGVRAGRLAPDGRRVAVSPSAGERPVAAWRIADEP